MTIFDDIETFFDNLKDSPGDLTFETLITILTIENLNLVNHSYLTFNCDTGQHSQFLRCFLQKNESESQTELDFQLLLLNQVLSCKTIKMNFQKN